MIGSHVTIGSKYAHPCSYDDVIGRKGILVKIYSTINPYRLKGKHTICRVEIKDDDSYRHEWEVHIDDCIPVSNKDGKYLLQRVDD